MNIVDKVTAMGHEAFRNSTLSCIYADTKFHKYLGLKESVTPQEFGEDMFRDRDKRFRGFFDPKKAVKMHSEPNFVKTMSNTAFGKSLKALVAEMDQKSSEPPPVDPDMEAAGRAQMEKYAKKYGQRSNSGPSTPSFP